MQSLRLSRVIIPVLIGLSGAVYLVYTKFDRRQFDAIVWDGRAWGLIACAFLLLLLRHLSYTMRLRAVTGYVFSWLKYLELMVIWEFSTTITPTSKGGPFVTLFTLSKEGVAPGKAASAIFYTIILDSGFFVLFLPILLWIYGSEMLFPPASGSRELALAGGAFWATYSIMAGYWAALMILVFIRPKIAPVVMGWLGRAPVLKRWKSKFDQLGEEFATAAVELKGQPWSVHFQAIIGTLGAWTLKFAMINCLILAVAPQVHVDGFTQLFIYARMVAMFIIMAFTPTPGGAGIAEVMMPKFISDVVPPALGLVVALLWRGMAYYGYLIAGAIVAPNWIRKKVLDVQTPASTK